jgi:hypothetical protein
VPCLALHNPIEDVAQYPDHLDLHQRVTSAMCCIPRGEESRRLTNPVRDDHTLRQRREVPTWFPDSSRKAGVGDWTFWMWKFRKVAPLLALLVLASYADETSRGVTSIGSHTFGRARGIDRDYQVYAPRMTLYG